MITEKDMEQNRSFGVSLESPLALALRQAQASQGEEGQNKERSKPSSNIHVPVVRKPIREYHRQAADSETAILAAQQAEREREAIEKRFREYTLESTQIGEKWNRWIQLGNTNTRIMTEAVQQWLPIYQSLRGFDFMDRARILSKLGEGMDLADVEHDPAKMNYLRRLKGSKEARSLEGITLTPGSFFFIVSFESLSNMNQRVRFQLHESIRQQIQVLPQGQLAANKTISRWFDI